jgi:CBS domain-containing protein
MKVGQVMTTRVSWVGPDFTVAEIARRMRADDIGSVPVAHNDRLIGMVTDRDIVLRAVADGGEIERVTARQVMSASVLYCFEDENVATVLHNMGENQVRRLPVVDRDKRLVGVVSLGDLSRAAHDKAGSALREISEKPARASGPKARRPPLEQLLPSRH